MSDEVLRQAQNLSGHSGMIQAQKRNRFRIIFEDPSDPTRDLTLLTTQCVAADVDIADYHLHCIFEQPENDGTEFMQLMSQWMNATIEFLDGNDNVTSKLGLQDLRNTSHGFSLSCLDAEVVQHNVSYDFHGATF